MPCGHFEHFPNKLYIFFCFFGVIKWPWHVIDSRINHITKFTTLTKCQFWIIYRIVCRIVLDSVGYFPLLTTIWNSDQVTWCKKEDVKRKNKNTEYPNDLMMSFPFYSHFIAPVFWVMPLTPQKGRAPGCSRFNKRRVADNSGPAVRLGGKVWI